MKSRKSDPNYTNEQKKNLIIRFEKKKNINEKLFFLIKKKSKFFFFEMQRDSSFPFYSQPYDQSPLDKSPLMTSKTRKIDNNKLKLVCTMAIVNMSHDKLMEVSFSNIRSRNINLSSLLKSLKNHHKIVLQKKSKF